MANLFILNVAGIVAPVAADKNANRLIALAVDRMNTAAAVSGEAVEVPSAPEPIDVEARRRALFTSVTEGSMTMDEAVVALKALDTEIAEAAKAAASASDPAVLLLAGEPATAAEIKRAFRGAEDGHTVEVASLDGSVTGTIAMFRV